MLTLNRKKERRRSEKKADSCANLSWQIIFFLSFFFRILLRIFERSFALASMSPRLCCLFMCMKGTWNFFFWFINLTWVHFYFFVFFYSFAHLLACLGQRKKEKRKENRSVSDTDNYKSSQVHFLERFNSCYNVKQFAIDYLIDF